MADKHDQLEIKTVHIRVEGRVQGVFFRECTRNEAASIGITGWVMNMPDGAVEGVFQGSSSQLTEITDWLHEGSPMSRVSAVFSTPILDEKKYSTFCIRYH